ncbi:hypothetical protein N7E81_06980 [Reichenbachiella carrageenanivorans]|uniref:Cell division protein FtsL n=1 Tax=Reichenbachiella carrageenanivorans TaxID=2979869 RepID=A0ABY6D3Y4_9BACT|nr:hypothetical protein [Reichenbachiella carrageenanivorans]UXX80842.1 hypothetical protein N7E81_06980 [Reichenbachiella carrageenanivorans]
MIKNLLIGVWVMVCIIFAIYANACKQSADRQMIAVLESKVMALENIERAKWAEEQAIASIAQEKMAQRKSLDISRKLKTCK